ncbi:MAG: hypothetical protein ACOVOT_05000, partial [Rubrivivax sp.]
MRAPVLLLVVGLSLVGCQTAPVAPVLPTTPVEAGAAASPKPLGPDGPAVLAPAPPPAVLAPPKPPPRPPKIGLALGGGAARGFAHSGVIQVLEDAGLRPE